MFANLYENSSQKSHVSYSNTKENSKCKPVATWQPHTFPHNQASASAFTKNGHSIYRCMDFKNLTSHGLCFLYKNLTFQLSLYGFPKFNSSWEILLCSNKVKPEDFVLMIK